MSNLSVLKKEIRGDVWTQHHLRKLYSTDASPYKKLPQGVVFPIDEGDVATIIAWANSHNVPLIPRAAGTSLGGQVVGSDLVVDLSRHMKQILEVNASERWVRVQPGVILDELNLFLKRHNLYFGPETSTSNRCTIGGMVGNNSCGSHSLVYGSTRDHLIKVKGYLADGSLVAFEPLNKGQLEEKLALEGLEGDIYRYFIKTLQDKSLQETILQEYPDRSINRRNTGYALDVLMDCSEFVDSEKPFNLCKLIAGSEGTLMFVTEITLNTVPPPPKETAVICVHFNSLEDALQANIHALKFKPRAIELIDHNILELTKHNIQQSKNRSFIQGTPQALIIIEHASDEKNLAPILQETISTLQKHNLGYHFPILYNEQINKVWELRKAGLGILFNLPGDAKPIAFIEDAAITPTLLPMYVSELKAILNEYNTSFACFAHIGSGEIHFRPIINLKEVSGQEAFKGIATKVAHLVKKYNGSLSGEHGDGTIRSSFIPLMLGEKVYEVLREVKNLFDPKNLFNRHKIIDPPPIDHHLRYSLSDTHRTVKAGFKWRETNGSLLQASEKCNGSGDCLKTPIIGGVMCPTYMATSDERFTTRGRTNIFREYLTLNKDVPETSRREATKIVSTCLSCKGCKAECPSNVDMGKMKVELLYQSSSYSLKRLRDFAVSQIATAHQFYYRQGRLGRIMQKNGIVTSLVKKTLGIHNSRSLPLVDQVSVEDFYATKEKRNKGRNVCLLTDEFTNFTETHIGKQTIEVLEQMGYKVSLVTIEDSGRSSISKGFLKKAKLLAEKNIQQLLSLPTETPIIGTEPSTVLTFRDEYLDLVSDEVLPQATLISQRVYTTMEFLSNELSDSHIDLSLFKEQAEEVWFHSHCFEKALSTPNYTAKVLKTCYPKVKHIPAGCCGMAGSFGYEKGHYELSKRVAHTTLIPSIKKADEKVLICASGISCRHQIADFGDTKSYHPMELLHKALFS